MFCSVGSGGLHGSRRQLSYSLYILYLLPGDTMIVKDPIAMNLCSAAWAVVAYTVADVNYRIHCIFCIYLQATR